MSENIREMFGGRFKEIEQEITAINKARDDIGRAFTELVKKIDNLGAREITPSKDKTFKEGDTVQGGFYTIVVEQMVSRRRFAGTVLESVGNTTHKRGYRANDWLVGNYKLIEAADE